ncbi:MAG: hypothetical protein J0I54_17855 [Bosea sp.]|uniref:hypothetical protein n=1 Tax=unclassified Bosea (in: a-proteobacteria) TaxID=2653178 RepID=UPI000962FD01|nr:MULTISPECIES: hypothetical protein [unclassified Bosea (in: a-proteobacteria)]MBN9458499.1 hypothetical protein [Bosea sp. (in: a-proteobacteria)]OJV06800.1 MAG: hypothetical protein BGO20_00095 [Bosea sp. 67-29]
MKWAARKSLLGYWTIALLAADEAELGAASVNQFGRVRFFSKRQPSPLGDWFPPWEALNAAADIARQFCPPEAGRYGWRGSARRGELCGQIAAALNAAGVFPAEARAA